jgi:osmotically-inducible protein OsmY
MSNRYDDREYDRGERSGRQRDSEYGRSSNRTQERYRWGREDEDDNNRQNRNAGESRWGGQYGRSRSGGEYGGGRESSGYGGGQESHGRSEYDRGWESGGGERDRSKFGGGGYGYTGGGSTGGGSMGGSTGGDYGSSSGGGQGSQQRFGESSNRYSQRYDYPSDYPSRGMHSNQGERTFDYDRSRFGRGQEGGYEYDRDRQGSQGGQGAQGGEDRGWWDRASDAVASWFGDEEADRRRRMDHRREEWRGKGPKGYRRSDERIREDINDRLSEGYLDASDVEVTVSNAEVTLTGTVNNRWDKRRAEDIAESVNGVTHVENRVRVKQHGSSMSAGGTSTYGAGSDTSTASMGAGGVGTHGTTGTGTTGSETSTGTTGGATSSSSAAAGGTGTRAKS